MKMSKVKFGWKKKPVKKDVLINWTKKIDRQAYIE